MTNDLEKQFFDTFGIEPKPLFSTRNGYTKDHYIYPQITDTHYLKLICLINISLIKIVKLRGDNLEQLKNFILQGCLTDYEFYSNSSLLEHREQAENLKQQVQELFKEG